MNNTMNTAMNNTAATVNHFVKAMDINNKTSYTENGALCLNTTGHAIVDAFAKLGGMRNAYIEDITETFNAAYEENETLALKLLFYLRDCREGLGERNLFRTIAAILAFKHTDAIKRNLKYIPEFGRFDDLFAFFETPVENDAFDILKQYFDHDMATLNTSETCSLVGKWLPSCNASSPITRRNGKKIAKYFGLSEKQYRKDLTALRKKIDVVEAKMSANNWENINYEAVPSKAMNNYRNALCRHDNERFTQYLRAVDAGDAKINSSVLYPYDLVEKYLHGYTIKKDATIEAQWKALPNFVTNANDFLCVVDVSGSMTGRPMATSIGLGVYFAQRTTSAFHNRMITFSNKPEWITIKDDWDLARCVDVVRKADWGGSTDLEAAFELILSTAIKNHIKPKDMPKNLVVITDMEINGQAYYETYTEPGEELLFMERMEKKFKLAGYEAPCIVWWNVNARHNTFHAEYTDANARFISGQSATVFKQLCENMGESALDMVYNTLMSERYKDIK